MQVIFDRRRPLHSVEQRRSQIASAVTAAAATVTRAEAAAAAAAAAAGRGQPGAPNNPLALSRHPVSAIDAQNIVWVHKMWFRV